MTSLPIETGNIVHQAVAQSLKNVIEDEKLPDVNQLVSRGYSALKIRLNSINSKQFIENELDGGIVRKGIADALQKVEKALHTFVGHPLLPEIISSLEARSNSCLIDPPGYGEFRIRNRIC